MLSIYFITYIFYILYIFAYIFPAYLFSVLHFLWPQHTVPLLRYSDPGNFFLVTFDKQWQTKSICLSSSNICSVTLWILSLTESALFVTMKKRTCIIWLTSDVFKQKNKKIIMLLLPVSQNHTAQTWEQYRDLLWRYRLSHMNNLHPPVYCLWPPSSFL